MANRFPGFNRHPQAPIAPQFGNNAKRTYDELQYSTDSRGYGTGHYHAVWREADKHILDTVKHFARPGEPVLELGCNVGSNLRALDKAGYKTFGIDISAEALAYIPYMAKNKHSVETACWDFAENGDLPPEWVEKYGNLHDKFKAIVAVHTLSHLSGERLVATMQKMQKYLAPGGVFIVSIIDPPKAGTPHKLYTDAQNCVAGFLEHDEQTIARAFQGLRPLHAFSRPFNQNDIVTWILPKDRLRWYVFQKV